MKTPLCYVHFLKAPCLIYRKTAFFKIWQPSFKTSNLNLKIILLTKNTADECGVQAYGDPPKGEESGILGKQ